MNELLIILGVITVCLLSVFIVTYEIDSKSLNKGVCPRCGKPLVYFKKIDRFTDGYWCPDNTHFHVAFISNPYLKLRYGRKLKKK